MHLSLNLNSILTQMQRSLLESQQASYIELPHRTSVALRQLALHAGHTTYICTQVMQP